MKTGKTHRGLALILLLPLQIIVPRDSAETTVRIKTGSGTYLESVESIVTRYEMGVGDCGPYQEPVYRYEPHTETFREVGIDIAHKPAASGKSFGIQGHMITYGRASNNYILAPYIDLQGPRSAVNFGVAFVKKDLPGLASRNQRVLPTFLLRAGPPGLFATVSFLHEIPLTTSGYFQLGLGSSRYPSRKMAWWIGMSALPFENVGLSVKLGIKITPSVELNGSTRLGSSSGKGWHVSENATSIGLAFKLKH